jgi:predicted ATPase
MFSKFSKRSVALGGLVVGATAFAYNSRNDNVFFAKEQRRGKVVRVLLTGGPCGGKSSSLARLKKKLEGTGVRLFTVPEAATIIFSNGAEWVTLTDDQRFVLLEELMKLQISLEDKFITMAESTNDDCIVVCDRGLMDNEAYVPYPEMWNLLRDHNKWSIVEMRDKRYDKVLHLMSAALGAEKFYTTENNQARRETVQEAQDLDKKIQRSYIGHADLTVVTNEGNFETKLEKVTNSILLKCGLQDRMSFPIEKRRYLVSDKSYLDFGALEGRVADIDMDITFLDPTVHGKNSCVYRRGQHGVYEYYYRDPYVEEAIAPQKYVILKKQKHPKKTELHKNMKYFLFNDDYFSYNTVAGRTILEVSAPKGRDIKFPPGINATLLKTNELTEEELANQ